MAEVLECKEFSPVLENVEVQTNKQVSGLSTYNTWRKSIGKGHTKENVKVKWAQYKQDNGIKTAERKHRVKKEASTKTPPSSDIETSSSSDDSENITSKI